MSKCDICLKKSRCRLIETLPDNAVSKFAGCWQYEEATNDNKKLFLSRYLVDKAGGVERIEKLFDYQCEVVIVPDALYTPTPSCTTKVEEKTSAAMAQGPD